MEPAEPWWTNSFMVTFAFRCNIACTFCMVEDVLDVFEGTSLEAFRRVAAAEPDRLRGARRIIFSGGEVTLARDLPEYAAFARSLPGIEHVRIQTNAIRLGNRAYLRSLLDAGVDEFFVSLHAPDAPLCDAITQQRGSFAAILAGMEAIAEAGATLITNTAIVEANYARLAEIVDVAAPFRPRSMELWNYWPRADEDGGRMHAARVGDVRGPLLAALGACTERGIPPVVKWFPRCLLGEYAWCQDDGQPPALIEDRYWAREPRYACLYEGVCQDGGSPCAGLSYPYIRRFGWEERLLRPRRRAGAGGEGRPRGDATRSLVTDVRPVRSEQAALTTWLQALDIRVGSALSGFTLASAAKAKEPGSIALTFTRADRSVNVRLCATDPARKCFSRTRSLDIFYTRVEPGMERDVEKLLLAFTAQIRAKDPGGITPP